MNHIQGMAGFWDDFAAGIGGVNANPLQVTKGSSIPQQAQAPGTVPIAPIGASFGQLLGDLLKGVTGAATRRIEQEIGPKPAPSVAAQTAKNIASSPMTYPLLIGAGILVWLLMSGKGK